MKRYLFVLILALSALYMGCSEVHEFPGLADTPKRKAQVSISLNLDLSTDLPIHQILDLRTEMGSEVATLYDLRHTISIHKAYTDGSYRREADTVIVVTEPVNSVEHTVQLEIDEGLYNILVWTDYVDAGQNSDKYYNTTDLSEIILTHKEDYVGNNLYRDAFRGAQGCEVSADNSNNHVTVSMQRTLARFEFISTDYEAFVDEVVRRSLQQDQTASAEELTRNFRIEDYKAVFNFSGYMNCSYNLFSDRPADAWTGIKFENQLSALDNGEVWLGFDYMFVGTIDSVVAVWVEIYDKNGNLISGSPVIDIPLLRNKRTVVKGEFLTTQASGGVKVDPGFEGNHNVHITD